MDIEGRYPLKEVRMLHCGSDTLKNICKGMEARYPLGI